MMYDDDPIHHALYVEDPPSLQEPDVTTAYPDLVSACIWDTEISGDQTLWPGYYCGSSYDVTTCAPLAPFACTTQTFYHPAIKISGGTVYLKSGVYYLDSGMHRDIVKCCGWARSGGVFLNHQSILENLSL